MAQEIPQTSLASRAPTPENNVTVRFRKWTTHGNTAYQRGQFAGFSERDAAILVRNGAADIVERRSVLAGAVLK